MYTVETRELYYDYIEKNTCFQSSNANSTALVKL